MRTSLRTYLYLATLLISFTLLNATASAASAGHLYLVSTGCGDLDNMTIRAHRILSEADIYFAMNTDGARETYPDLIGDKPVYKAGHGLFTTTIRRGKKEELNAMEEEARQVIRGAVSQGKTVAVLCSGDPTIYCPHTGFMTEFADLRPEMIPGISSFNAANAALGRSVTSGSGSGAVILTAGVGKQTESSEADPLEKLAESRATMVFFMMRKNLPTAVEKLKTSYPGDTPIALVAHAGYRDTETIVTATLDTILEKVDSENLTFEQLVYVGDFLK